jgi:hypothetical protein
MSPHPSPINPSQTVERIREIIVGRQLERLEQRVARIESGVRPAASDGPAAHGLCDDRLFATEAQIEAIKQSVHRLGDAQREQTEARFHQHREEIQRLSGQIQQVAALKAPAVSQPEIKNLESKVTHWLRDWQGSIQTHLAERDRRLVTQLRDEFAAVWEQTESQLTRLESRAIDRESIEERFRRIALAARALAECASPSLPSSRNPS